MMGRAGGEAAMEVKEDEIESDFVASDDPGDDRQK